MLKNLMLMALGAVIAIVILGAAGLAYAQTQTPPTGLAPYDQPFGGMGRWNGGGMMRHWSQSGQFGFMHEEFIAAMAPKLGMSVEALQAELAGGKTLWQIAAEKGMGFAEFQTLWLEAKKEALSNLVSKGVITQAQADWMLSRMDRMFQNGRGFGAGRGLGCGGNWAGPRNRWAPTPTP
ncbi:MAG: DUF2680 domain-containing protein [Anaerolineales bacterium]